MKSPLFALAFTLIAANSLLAQADLLTNGSFENWEELSGAPERGLPTGWSAAGTTNPVRSAGFDGTGYSTTLTGNSGLLQTVSAVEPIKAFNLSFDFAASLQNTGRSLQFDLNQSATSTAHRPVNIIIEAGTETGKLSLKAYNGTGWTTLGANIFDASTYDSATGEWTTLNAYTLSFDITFGPSGESGYSVSYGVVGSSLTTLATADIFSTAPLDGGLTQIRFLNTASGAGRPSVIDNVSLAAIPEPSSAALMLGAGILGLVVVRRRR